MVGVAVVVGVGPGLGLSIARRFAREKYTVAILSRDLEKLTKMAEDIVEKEKSGQVCAIRIDCADSKSVKEAFEAVNSLGPVEALVYNTNTPFPWPPPKFTEINVESFQRSITIPCVGAFLCVQQVIQGMVERQKGTLLFTGATASMRGGAGFSEIACGKFALRALAQSLAREYQPQGIHVAHIIVDGVISSPRYSPPPQHYGIPHRKYFPEHAAEPDVGGRYNTIREEDAMMKPDTIAEIYWHVHSQHKSAWTHELDVRPFPEKF
ncbi:unnamed protein product [Sphagnum jensenii]|uniref:Uncharacterized protein n=1 Tax=Sphagnum jensenii TaxID=128206 RepID=A0ABP1APL5_9BRYO